MPTPLHGFTDPVRFRGINWSSVPEALGVYAIHDLEELLYVGMAGRDGQGNLRKRLKDHASGQVVNMFAQYLFFARAQFLSTERVTRPSQAKALCQQYIQERCLLSWRACASPAEARLLESSLKQCQKPALNGNAQSAA
jgi:excinuclease UvrABC nuclease subunit